MSKLRNPRRIHDDPQGGPSLFRDAAGDDVAPEPRARGRRLIAVIGIDRYHQWPRLDNAVNDARGTFDAFLRLGFEPAAEPLYDDAATAEAMRHLVTDKLAALGKHDSLIVFFAGHGHTVTQTYPDGDSFKTGYVIPVDSDPPGGSAARWLRLDTWLSDVARLPVKHLLVFLDACHSGIALGSLIKWRGSSGATESFKQLGRRRSRKVITSAMEDQRAMDSGPLPGHSLFTGCLLEGLDGRISPRGALVTGSQIGMYLQQRVTSYSESVQTPDFGDLERDLRGELILSTEPVHGRSSSGAIPVEGPALRFRRSLAVVIGIDTYGDGISPLRSAAADARAIAEALHRDHGFETRCLFDADASLPRLLAVLRDELPAALGAEDRLVFYFAGRGIAHAADAGPLGYLMPAHARRQDRDGFLPIQVLYDQLSRLSVRHALVVLDCCFAMPSWPGPREPPAAIARLYRERYERHVANAAWQVLISLTTDPLAFDLLAGDRGERAERHSPFARALLDGLAGAAVRSRGSIVTADDLATFVRDRVAAAVGPAGGTPSAQLFSLARHGGGQFVFQVPGRPLELEPAPPLEDAGNPYRGLHGFGEQDRAFYFGHDGVVRSLTEAIAAQPVTVLVGPPGCGKSSLIHAGVVPALRARGWTVLTPQRPGGIPLEALRALTEELIAGPTGSDVAAAWLAAAGGRASEEPWLVVLDQAEDLLASRVEPCDRAALLEALAGALRCARSLRLVVVVRSEAESLLRRAALQPWWQPGRFVMPALTRDRLRQVIEQPAIAAALHFEPAGLVERLLDDAGSMAAPLPLVSFALTELYRACCTRWQGGDRSRALREADYDAIGGLAEALDRRATALHDELVVENPAYAVTIRNLFVRIAAALDAAPGGGQVPLDALVYDDPAENRRLAEVVTRFEAAGLIARAADRRGGVRGRDHVGPVRDELVRGWACVGPWLDELDTPAGSRALLVALSGAARAWRDHDRPDAQLWSAPRAALVERLGQARPFAFTLDEAEFVQRSTATARRRRSYLVHRLRAGRHLLAGGYQEIGRQLLLDGHAFEAAPYLLEARRAGAAQAPIRMLFAAATRHLASVPLEHRGEVLSARFCGDGVRVVTVSRDGTARIWSAVTGEPLGPPLGHDDTVWGAAWSRDGTRVVTASEDHTARIWDAATGTLVAPPLHHQAGVRSAVFSPDGTRVLTASEDRTARVWDAVTASPQAQALEHHGPVRTAVFSPGGTRVLTASDDRTARVWDAATGLALCQPLRHRGPVASAAFSSDGKHVVTASEDGTAQIWDAVFGKPMSPPLEHRAPVTSAAFSPDDARVVTASEDRTARIWVAVGGVPASPSLEHAAPVVCAVFSADGTRVLTASADHTARLWDASTGNPLAGPFEHHGTVNAAGFSPDGGRVVTAGADHIARVWDATSDSSPLRLEHRGRVESAVFSSDGTRVVTASSDHTARIWSTVTGAPQPPGLEHHDSVLSAAFSPDGARIVTTSSDRTARVWDAGTGKPLSPPLEHDGEVRSAAFSLDGTRVVTASSDRTARVWDAMTGEPLSPPLEHRSFVWSAVFSPDGARVVTASSDETARIWDAVTGQPVSPPLEHRGVVRGAVFSCDGARVVTASWDSTARIWDANTGVPLGPPLAHHNSVWCAAFDRQAVRVVTASLDRAAQIWDAATGQLVARPLVHRDNVWSAAFSPDGTRIVTASADHTARVWDAITGNPLCAPLEHRGEVRGAVFSPDGTRVVTVGEDETAYVWAMPLDAGTLADWTALVQRGPYRLLDGVLSLCPPTEPPGTAG